MINCKIKFLNLEKDKCFSLGKIYKIKNGLLYTDEGGLWSSRRFSSGDDMLERFASLGYSYEIIDSGDNLSKLLKYWQKKLRMLDWDLYLKENCTEDVGDNLADCFSQSVFKLAKIRIADRSIFESHLKNSIESNLVDKIMESTLVHELLHAKFAIVHDDIEDKRSRNSAIYSVLHQEIEDISIALVSEKYNISQDLLKFGWSWEDEYSRV